MARIRTIKPEFWSHEGLSELPEATHMLAAALLNYADDEGYFNANAKLVQAACCPLREPSVSIHDSLTMLANMGYLRLGTGPDGKRYGHVVHFEEHQRVNRKTPSKIKDVGVVWDGSPPPHPQLTEPSHPEGKGREQGKERKSSGSSLRSEPAAPPAAASPSSTSRPQEPPGLPDLSKLAPAGGDWKGLLFGPGLLWLKFASKRKPGGLQSLIGRWRRDLGDDDRALFGLMAECQRLDKASPTDWISAAVQRRKAEADDENFGATPVGDWGFKDWIDAFDAYAERKHWPARWGPPPEDDACTAPAELIQRWRNGWRRTA